jgi:hypothetical protein
MKEYWKFDGMKFEGANYTQYFEFENAIVLRQINVNVFQDGISFLDSKNPKEAVFMIDQPLTDMDRIQMDIISAQAFENLWKNKSSL